MPKRFDGFIGPWHATPGYDADSQRAVNLYPEPVESPVAKARNVLRGTPGLDDFCTLPTTPVRGLLSAGAPLSGSPRLFAVGGSKLYEVDSSGTATELGDVGNDGDDSPVQMFLNGNQLYVVSAGKAYVDNGDGPAEPTFPAYSGTVNGLGNQFVAWVSGDKFDATMTGRTITINGNAYTVHSVISPEVLFTTATVALGSGLTYSMAGADLPAKTGAYIDGYFIAHIPESRQFNISGLNNGLEWDELDFAMKAGYPDHIGAVLADHSDLWLFGESQTEIWNHTGNADFPFERNPNGNIEQGISAPWSACKLMNGVAWLGQDTRGKIVAWWAQGYRPQRVSNYAVENRWDVGVTSDAISYTYTDNGHHFWVITFPTLDTTWVFDATTGWWHERAYWNGSALERHRGRCHAFCFDKHLVGDHTTGVIYQMSATLGTDNGTNIRRIRQAPHLSEDHVRLFHHELIVNAQTDTSSTPNFYLSYSDDQGTSWSTEKQVTTAAGFQHEPHWRRLGAARDRIYQLRVDVASNLTLIDAYQNITKGTD
jgi:hypothetical protein